MREGLRDAVVEQDRQWIEGHVPAHLLPLRPPDVLNDLAGNARPIEEGFDGRQIGTYRRRLTRYSYVGRLSQHLPELGERALGRCGLDVGFFLLWRLRTSCLPPRSDRHAPSFIMLDDARFGDLGITLRDPAEQAGIRHELQDSGLRVNPVLQGEHRRVREENRPELLDDFVQIVALDGKDDEIGLRQIARIAAGDWMNREGLVHAMDGQALLLDRDR